MPRYDRHYDYGMRGFQEGALARRRNAPRGYDMDVRSRELPASPVPNRVVQRYNRDYVYGGRGGYPRNYNMFTGDRIDRIGDERAYHRPYITNGGTWTHRGSPYPTGFGPDYVGYDGDFNGGW